MRILEGAASLPTWATETLQGVIAELREIGPDLRVAWDLEAGEERRIGERYNRNTDNIRSCRGLADAILTVAVSAQPTRRRDTESSRALAGGGQPGDLAWFDVEC